MAAVKTKLFGFLLFGTSIANAQGYMTNLAPAILSLYLDQQGRTFERLRKNGPSKGKFKTYTNFKPAF